MLPLRGSVVPAKFSASRILERPFQSTIKCVARLCPHSVSASDRGNSCTTIEEREIGRSVKEKLCFLAFDCDTELKSIPESSNTKQTYVLSEGNIITVGAERCRCESIFSSQVSLAKNQRNARLLLSRTSGSVTLTSA